MTIRHSLSGLWAGESAMEFFMVKRRLAQLGAPVTCPKCREQGVETRVEFVKVGDMARSVESQIMVRCPKLGCGYESGPYSI